MAFLAKSGRYSGIERVSLARERDQQPSIQRKMEQDKACFTDSGLIPKGNANYAFILQSLEAAQGLLPLSCQGAVLAANNRKKTQGNS